MFHKSKSKKKVPKRSEKVSSTKDAILISLLASLTEDQKAAIIEFIRSFE